MPPMVEGFCSLCGLTLQLWWKNFAISFISRVVLKVIFQKLNGGEKYEIGGFALTNYPPFDTIIPE